MLKRFLYLILLLVIILQSCKPEPSSPGCAGAGPIEYSPGATPDLHPDVYPYLFDMGSSWIYDESISGESDTVSVFSNEEIPGNYSACSAIPDEQHILLAGFDKDYYLSFSGGQMYFRNAPTHFYEITYRVVNSTLAEDYILLDSLVLPSQTFYDVGQTGPRDIVLAENDTVQEYYFFVEEIGLVRKERYQNSVLISDHVLSSFTVVF